MSKKPVHKPWHYIVTILLTLLKSFVYAVIWIVVGYIGLLIFLSKKTPLDLIFGLPLILIGGGMIINNLWSIVLVFFSPVYNKGVCPVCSS